MPTRGIITDRDPGGGRPVAAERAWAARAPAHDNRRALDGILWVPRTDAPWRDLPGTVGKWNSVFLRFSRWTKAGLWDVMLHVLTPARPRRPRPPRRGQHERARPPLHVRRRRGDRASALGRSRGGYGTKVRPRSDAGGLPLGFVLTPGEDHETTAVAEPDALVDARPRCWLSDRAYDSDALCVEPLLRGVLPVIPPRSNGAGALACSTSPQPGSGWGSSTKPSHPDRGAWGK